MHHIYVCSVDGDERLTFSGDLSHASAAVRYDGKMGDDYPTPFQTADGSHNYRELAELLNDWLRSEGGEAWSDGEPVSITEF